MNTNIKIFTVCIFLCTNVMGQKTITTPYDYPVKPGMQEWVNFQTGQAMLDACQIPVGILAKLTTNALVETCLNYPLIFDYLSFNDEREGIQFMINNFNGLEELSKRADGASCLLKAYKKRLFSILSIIIKTYCLKNLKGFRS